MGFSTKICGTEEVKMQKALKREQDSKEEAKTHLDGLSLQISLLVVEDEFYLYLHSAPLSPEPSGAVHLLFVT